MQEIPAFSKGILFVVPSVTMPHSIIPQKCIIDMIHAQRSLTVKLFGQKLVL